MSRTILLSVVVVVSSGLASMPVSAQDQTAFPGGQPGIASPLPDQDLDKIERKFEKLQQLKDKGWITDEDYERKKRQFLDRL